MASLTALTAPTTIDISLEAFESSLRNKRSVWFIQEDTKGFPPGFYDMVLSETPVFQRKVLLITKESEEFWRHIEPWDSILTITTSQDWSLAMTHMMYQPKPCLVIAAPELLIPPQVYQRLQNITIIQLAFLKPSLNRAHFTADCVLLPQLNTDQETQIVQTILQNTGQQVQQQALKNIIRDTKTAGASFLVSSIDEPNGRQCMYWYYATQATKSPKLKIILNLIEAVLQRVI